MLQHILLNPVLFKDVLLSLEFVSVIITLLFIGKLILQGSHHIVAHKGGYLDVGLFGTTAFLNSTRFLNSTKRSLLHQQVQKRKFKN